MIGARGPSRGSPQWRALALPVPVRAMLIVEALPAFGFGLDYRLVLETAPLPRRAGQVLGCDHRHARV